MQESLEMRLGIVSVTQVIVPLLAGVKAPTEEVHLLLESEDDGGMYNHGCCNH